MSKYSDNNPKYVYNYGDSKIDDKPIISDESFFEGGNKNTFAA